MKRFLYTEIILTLLISLSHSFSPYAYEVAGRGVDPATGQTMSGTLTGQAYGIEASQLTLQQIADYKGSWAWIDADNNGIAERYYLLNQNSYLVNGMTPDGLTVNEYGQWYVDGKIQYRAGSDRAKVQEAAQQAAALHGNSFDGIYTGTVTFSGAKGKSYTIQVSQLSYTELSVSIGDDEGVTAYEYEYAGLNTYHNGVTMWKPKKKSKGDYLLFSGYNSIVYYNYDGTLAGQLIKIC